MNYTDFKKMTGAIPESQGFEYSLVFLWHNPSILPLGVVSIKGCTDKIVRIPRMTVNSYGNSVPVIAVGNYTFGNNKNVSDIILSPQTIRIAGHAFSGCTALERIYIPNCIEMIGKNAFEGCTSLADIYFGGSPDDWKKIKTGPGNDPLLHAKIHYGCEYPECQIQQG